MKDFFDKWLSTIATAATLAILANAFATWMSVHDLVEWRTSGHLLEEAAQAAQLQSQISMSDQRAKMTEVALDRLSAAQEMQFIMLQNEVTDLRIQLARLQR